MVTRGQLLAQPRSGARPLPGSPGSGQGPASSSRANPARARPSAARRPASQNSRASRPRAQAAAPATSQGTSRAHVQRQVQPQSQPSTAGQFSPLAQAGGQVVHYGQEGAGALLALFAYPMFIALLRGGPPAMWAWVRAKWANQATGTGPTGASGGTSNEVTAIQQARARAAQAPARKKKAKSG